MSFISDTEKYEVVIGIENDITVNRMIEREIEKMIKSWQKYAKEYFDKTGVYVSAIVNEGRAVYNEDWGCPDGGERTLTFNCTRNPKFIEDKYEYQRGIHYIVANLKKEFNQHTITITLMHTGTGIMYITDEDNDKLENIIKKYKEEENNE